MKPDSWERPRNSHPKVLVLYGLYTHHYRLEKAVKALDPDAEIKISANWNAFPPTYAELLQYDLVVMSDVPVGPDYANVMIGDTVRHAGTGLLCLGGMASYGGGQWRATRLMDVFPAKIPSPFDIKRHRRGVRPKPAAKHPAAENLRFPRQARFWWRHEVEPKPGTTVILKGSGKPLAIASAVGKGRVIAVTATCHGEARKGQTEAWTTPAWQQFLTQTMKWLIERE